MSGNTDEKEKCLEKLNEMQIFLPFLDFMIDKIRKKNYLPLEYQLSKFQHIKSVIIDKNGKYTLENLNNIEDILLKLINKLDYKGISPKEKKESVETKSESLTLPKRDQIEHECVSNDVYEAPASPKSVDTSNNTVDMIMKSMKMTVVQNPRQDEKKEVPENKDDKKDTETEGNVRNSKSAGRKSKDSDDCQGQSRKDTDCMKNRAPLDVLASSRKKLLKSVSGRGYASRESDTVSNKKTGNIDSGNNKDGTGCETKEAKPVKEKGKNSSISDKFLTSELSDISDDEYIIAEDVESDKIGEVSSTSDKVRNEKQSSDVTLSTRETTKFDWKSGESFSCSSDVTSKQKLRERLSADIAEVHKVPGKSVGGSLRSLKELKSSSQEREAATFDSQYKKSYSTERRSEHRSDSHEKSREHDLKKSSRKDRNSKDRKSKNRDRRRDEKHHHKIDEERDDKSGHSAKHSSRGERKQILLGEKRKKRKKKRLEIDKLDDLELVAFVKENVSDLPHLSKLSPDALRRAARSSFVLENLESEACEMETEKFQGTRDESLNSAAGTILSDTEFMSIQSETDDNDDEYSIRLIEEISPPPKRLEPKEAEAETKRTVPEPPHTTENQSHEMSMDPRIRPTIHPTEQLESHQFSDPRILYRVSKPLKSPTETVLPPRFPNPGSNCDPRMMWSANMCSDKQQQNWQYFPPQRYPMYDPGMNNPPRHSGVLPEHVRFHNYSNIVRPPIYNPCEPKSYGEYKQLKKQEMKNANRLRLSQEVETPTTPEESSVDGKDKPVAQKENEVKPVKPPPPNKPTVGDRKNIKVRGPKGTKAKPGVDTRKSFDGDRNHEDKSSTDKLSSPEGELVSPLDKLYGSDPKPVTGRGYGLQNFKIPKKGRSSSLEQQKTEEKDSNKTVSSSEIQRDSHVETSQECEEVKTDNGDKAEKISSEKVAIVEEETTSKDACEKITENNTSASGSDREKDTSHGNGKGVNCELNGEKEISESVTTCQDSTNTEQDKEKNVTDEKDKINGEESGTKPKPESDLPSSSKSSITEEITQEVVEALISKSFELGEGELLLEKVKLFKELALKLNSEKLKTIQKIINSESDGSSSSSESSSEGEKKRRRKTKSCDEKSAKKLKKDKKTVKSKEYVDSSNGSEDENVNNKVKQYAPAKMNENQPPKETDESIGVTQSEGDSPTKSKKSQRKTKLLEQIFNESTPENYQLSMSAENPSGKESDQKSKVKKGKGKTELDRLHEDIRSMFITSGVVTATGQRMCRILRETGGRMNNLDLVKESAKMVEEEKLASRRSIRLTNARSRSRSVDPGDRSRSTSLVSGHSDLTDNQPVVLLQRLDLESMAFAYKIADLPESFTRKRGRNVAKRGRGFSRGLTRSSRDEETHLNKMKRIYLARNIRKYKPRNEGNKKEKRKPYKGKKLVDIIQKLPLKIAKIRHLEIGGKENKKVEGEEPRKNPTMKNSKTEYVIEESSEILDYAFDKTRTSFTCLLCGYHTKSITAHYKTEHPESEVLISRLGKSEAARAAQDSKELNYNVTALDQACSLELIKKRVMYKLTGTSTFYCRMCNSGKITNVGQFFCHVSAHTGEYRYKCPVDGCDLTAANRDVVRNHISAKHAKQCSNKPLELFPLPSENEILFGYLCSRCNFVQVLKKNIEGHIQRVHRGAEDVCAIKIDLSGKVPEGKESKKRTKVVRKKKNRCGVGKGDDDDDDGSDYSPSNDGDEDYTSEGDGASDSSPSDEEDDDEEAEESYRSRANLNGNDHHRVRTRRSAVNEKRAPKETSAPKVGDVVSAAPNANLAPVAVTSIVPNLVKVKPEVVDKEDDNAEESSLDVEKKWTVGPLSATMSKREIMTYRCNVEQCRYTTHLFSVFEGHVLTSHDSAIWTGKCESCDKKENLPEIYKISDLLSHMERHIKPNGDSTTDENCQTVKEELNLSFDVEDIKASESASEDSVSFPEKPLLRVRSLIGDRLSKMKNREELSEGSPTRVSSTSAEPDKNKSEPLFTIKDVRSLNPNTEDEETCFTEEKVPNNYPPNAEVIAGKPVLIRSCPSPKIQIGSDSHGFPMKSETPVEVGQLMQLVPSPKPTEVPPLPGLNKLGFVATASIRILSPGSLTNKAVIVPTFTTTSHTVPISKTTDTSSPTVAQRMSSMLNPIISKGNVVISKVGDDAGGKKILKKKKLAPAPSTPPKPILPSPQQSEPSSKREQQYAVQFSGKNVKDAKVYQQMLTKKKLCQLFKCMAVECSFTCNNETIFTQHIGLHEAQQRIKGKKKPSNKVKKIFNWQQCAYCCEVLVHTGSALSQHILTEHGHCIYQCAYCFYRAVSPTYVDLHQNTVHKDTLKQNKKLIYKCKPVPGAVLSKQFEKQIKPQHIRPYQCEYCGSKFLIILHFFDHLTKQHQSVTSYNCHVCKIQCLKVQRLIAHYKLHSYGIYQCAYCLHGTENQNEMLYHLWNFHFSQPPVIYARILEDQTKTDIIALNDLKLITFDNDQNDIEHNLEEAGSEVEQEPDRKDSEPVPISLDISSIVTELGIKVDDEKKGSVVPKSSKELSSDLPMPVSVETMLPNAQFSTESDTGSDNSTVLISSMLSSVISQEKKDERDVSVPIGQLPIEVLEKFPNCSMPRQSDGDSSESVDKIIMNLQQKNTAVTVSPVIENKTPEGSPTPPPRSVHKLPPTVPVNRDIITSVYSSKKVAIVKKLDDVQVKETSPLVFHQLCTTPRIPEKVQSQSVILAVPLVDSVKNVQVKDESGSVSPNQNAGNLKRPAEDTPETLKKVGDAGILKRLCLGSPKSPAVITISPVQESSLRISDVRSLSTEKKSPVVLQPPIIRVEDFAGTKQVDFDDAKASEPEKVKKQDSPKEKSMEPPSSPEVIILDPEEDPKTSRSELVEVEDSEDDADVKDAKKTVKVMTNKDLEIRKQMEQLRNQMENETDCLLLDDDTTQDGTGLSSRLDKSEDSKSCFSTREDTKTPVQDMESTTDSQQPSEESSDKTVAESNIQDGDSRTNDSEDAKTDESQPASEKKSEEQTEPEKEQEEEEEQQQQEEQDQDQQQQQQQQQQGLMGKDLYLCGNGNCNFSAETEVELKEHLYICDFSRESTVLVCPHCSRNFKHSSPYVEHIKFHGEKKYSCGLCNLLSPWEKSIVRHLKRKHKFSQLKTLPNDTKPGHFVVYPKNHKIEKQDGELNVYSPGDEDKLPLRSVYHNNVNCAKCPYYTKVRSNMVRHLKIHIKSVETEGSIVVPSTAPTNPVPCLDTKERMFDKMTNLAASSQMAQATKDKLETLSPEEEAKLPQFVPEQMRHKCCSPDCNYFTIDDNMLKHHIRALHDEINVYNCPHCRETVHLEFRFVPLDKIGQHLKYHDSRLYKCYHCTYFHHQKYIVEKHALEKHPERRYFVFTVREPKVESTAAVEEEQQQQQHHRRAAPNEPVQKMWKCGFCDNFESTVRMTVIEHLAKVHNTKSKFKCKFCDMRSSQYSAFTAHFASKHNGQAVECIRALVQVHKTGPEAGQNAAHESPNGHFDTTPLWQRDAPRVRHIRGILIEEEEVKTKKSKKTSSDVEKKVEQPKLCPPDMFYCPLCPDILKRFTSKSEETFRTHLYQELNFQQYACTLCGKMFGDRKDCERHHTRVHPNRTLSVNQTKGDREIKFWVDRVIQTQKDEIMERKRRLSTSDDKSEESQPPKKKKVQAKPVETTPAEPPKKKTRPSRLTRSSGSVELKTEVDNKGRAKRSSDDKSEFVRQTRSAVHASESVKKCPHCDHEDSNLNSLKNHIMLKHLKTGKWLCPYCGESFQTEKDATKHCRSCHPDEVPKAAPNPDEQMEELKDDFWVVEYGFGREKQQQIKSEAQKPCRRPTTSRKASTKTGQTPDTPTKPKSSNVYSCGYCAMVFPDQSSIVEHFETHHKMTRSDPQSSVVGTAIYYQCNACGGKIGCSSLDSHVRDKHPNVTVQFEIRRVSKFETKEQCKKCRRQSCECAKPGRTDADAEEKEECYLCPRCPEMSASYLDCIDHFNEHYPRYACSNCTLRFFTEKEIEDHQDEHKHKSPYKMTIPSENMLEEYKAGIKVRMNGVWMSLKASKRTNSTDEQPETKKVKSVTARKSTTQVPERRSHAESSDDMKELKIETNPEKISPSHSEMST